MKRRTQLQSFLPRKFVKWGRDKYLSLLDMRDRIQGSQNSLVPPRSLHFVGGGDFQAIGQDFFHYFVDICGVKPNEAILDIGCGTGRMAVPLIDYIRAPGSYLGFDLSKKAIQWCQNHITPLNSRFSFKFADIKNTEYNPKGKISATDYQFPCETSSIDFAFATSVFTHMRFSEMQNYLSELQRCLKPSGRAFLTFFILDGTNRDLVDTGKAAYPFSINLGDCYTVDRQTPERAIAYEDKALFKAFSDVGLYVIEPVYWGSWSGRKSMLSDQDIVVVKKEPAGPY